MVKHLVAAVLLLFAASCSDDQGGQPESSPETSAPDTSSPVSEPRGVALVSVGSSFGMCAGYCITELEIDDDQLRLTRSGHQGGPSQESTGQLTAAGLDLLHEVEAALSDVELEPVYGCPDCADGGASWVELSLASGVRRTTYQFRGPPDVLKEADQLGAALIDALNRCSANDVARPSDDCEPATP